jgi:hypothetical protein
MKATTPFTNLKLRGKEAEFWREREGERVLVLVQALF